MICNAFQAGSGECSCGGKFVKGLCVKPIKGNAVLFWSMVSIILLVKDIIHEGYEIAAAIFVIALVLVYAFKIVPLSPK